MKGLMQQALGDSWEKLPRALKSHYQFSPNVDIGHLDIDFPAWMTPYLWVLQRCGALLARQGRKVPTRVAKEVVADRQYWYRSMRFPDGQTIRFNSFWVSSGDNRLIEFVNPIMGLEMEVRIIGSELRYDGVRFVLQLGPLRVGLPEWLILGHTTIIEHAREGAGFAMDFRLEHPVFGRVFRYSGSFVTQVRSSSNPISVP